MRTVCRFADGWDMSQPYIGCFVYHGAFFACGLRGAHTRNTRNTRNTRKGHAASVALLRRERLRRRRGNLMQGSQARTKGIICTACVYISLSYFNGSWTPTLALIAAKLSTLITCSMRQASSAATFGETPSEVSHSDKKVCRS